MNPKWTQNGPFGLKLGPNGIHDWKAYVKPDEILKEAEDNNFVLDKISGLAPIPSFSGFQWIRTEVNFANYIISLKN